MLKELHIRGYLESIQSAKTKAFEELQKARMSARHAMCPGCSYCISLTRHKHIIEQTYEEVSVVIYSLVEGISTNHSFPKTMFPDFHLYRGFITHRGEYIPIYGDMSHERYREEYMREHGEEDAYRMISIHGRGVKTKVLFIDRKSAPTCAQYTLLRELMIDAEGLLSFHFEFDTRHPR